MIVAYKLMNKEHVGHTRLRLQLKQKGCDALTAYY